ncbi:MAG: Tetratricopeptide 2 repeat protein [Candidatus Solibacter sp.]|nr:Tetratricopeptide 2 repeat protein [Candidatus Solibacter sp.]
MNRRRIAISAAIAYTSFVHARVFAQRPPVETAWELIAKGDRSQAVALLHDIVRNDPHNADARLLLGSVLMEQGVRSESIAQLSEAVRLRPKSAEAHNALGEAYSLFGDPKSAQPAFQRAVLIDPAFAQARVNLASVLMQAGDSEHAAPHLERAIGLLGNQPDAAYPHYLRAKVYAERRDTAKAISDLERAVALRPDLAEAWSDLGEARKTLLDEDGALEALSRAVALNPDDAVAQTRLGLNLLNRGNPHEAIVPLQHAAGLDSNNQSTLNALQLALRKDGQTEQADAVKRRLAELLRDKDHADQKLVSALELNNQGSAFEKSGDIRSALERYRAALEIDPDHVGIRTNLAVALLKLGRWDEGISQMREALRRDPGNTNLQKGLEDAMAQAKAHGLVRDKD